MTVLRFSELSKSYRSRDGLVPAVQHASGALEPGELVGLVGPSGSGKSTLLLLLGLVEVPDAGVIELLGTRIVAEGEPLGDMRHARRRQLGYVFQRPNLIPFLTAIENVLLVLGLSGIRGHRARDRARSLLDEMGIDGKRDRYPHQLSGGEQQRVAICRALANAPKLICADEPTAALDGKRAEQVIETLRASVAAGGCAAIVSTHDMRLLPHFDRVLRIEDGLLAPAAETVSKKDLP